MDDLGDPGNLGIIHIPPLVAVLHVGAKEPAIHAMGEAIYGSRSWFGMVGVHANWKRCRCFQIHHLRQFSGIRDLGRVLVSIRKGCVCKIAVDMQR